MKTQLLFYIYSALIHLPIALASLFIERGGISLYICKARKYCAVIYLGEMAASDEADRSAMKDTIRAKRRAPLVLHAAVALYLSVVRIMAACRYLPGLLQSLSWALLQTRVRATHSVMAMRLSQPVKAKRWRSPVKYSVP